MGKVILPSLSARVAERCVVGSRLLENRAQPVDAHPGGVRRGRPDRPEVGGGPERELLATKRTDHFGKPVVCQLPAVIETDEILPVAVQVFTVHFLWPPAAPVAAGSVRYRWRVGPIQVATRATGADASGSTFTT